MIYLMETFLKYQQVLGKKKSLLWISKFGFLLSSGHDGRCSRLPWLIKAPISILDENNKGKTDFGLHKCLYLERYLVWCVNPTKKETDQQDEQI